MQADSIADFWRGLSEFERVIMLVYHLLDTKGE